MARSEENKPILEDGCQPTLKNLAELQRRVFDISPYDTEAREVWFQTAARLLAHARDVRQQLEWGTILARTYKGHLGRGMPLSIIIGKLFRKADSHRTWLLLPMAGSMAGAG